MTDTRSERVATVPRTVAGDPVFRFLLVVLGFAILIFGVGSVDVARENPMSTLDEFTHVDYAWKIANGEIPARGSTISPEILEEWSCVDQSRYPLEVACGTDGPPSAFPLRGENYNYSHPPVYYAITGAFAKAVTTVFPDVLFLTAARWSGLLWLLAGMILLYAVLRSFRIDWRISALTAALPFAWSPIFTSATIVTNDAPALLSSALALWLLSRYVMRGRIGIVLPLVVAVFVASMKVVNVLAVLMVALVVLISAVVRLARRKDRSQIRNIVGAIGAPIGVGLVFLGWTYFQRDRGPDDWYSPIQGISGLYIDGDPFEEWSSTAFRGFTQFDVTYVAPGLDPTVVELTTQFLAISALGSAFLCLALYRRSGGGALLGAAVLVGLLLYPLIIQLQVYMSTGGEYYFPNPSGRYAVTLHVLMIVCIGFAADRLRWPKRFVVAAATLLLLAALTVLV